MKFLDQPWTGDISGIQDVQSYSPEYNITTSMKKLRYIMTILDWSTPSDISVKQDVQSYSPEYNITTPKHTSMKMGDFLDL